MKNLKANSLGLSWDSRPTMAWVGRIDRFQWIQELWVIEGKITRPWRLLLYWRMFKGRQKISGSKWRFRFKIQLKRHLFPAKLWSSQNRFNIRLKVNLSLTKLWGYQYPVQKELISRKVEISDKLMVIKENLLPWCTVQNMGILPYGLSCYGHLGASCSSGIANSTLLIVAMPKLIRSLGGFLFKHRSYSNQREHSCRYPFD